MSTRDPRATAFAESDRNLREIADVLAGKMQDSGVKLLWGTANLFSHPRFMAGAATNPDLKSTPMRRRPWPAVWMSPTSWAARTTCSGAAGGYETLLNTDLSRELDQMARFLDQVVEYKHRIGFKGRS